MIKKTLLVPSGIGDLLWVLQTLKEPHHFEVCKSDKYRAWQLLDLVPSLVDGYTESNIPFSYRNPSITQLNSHLEAGRRIEQWNGTATFPIPLQTSQYKSKAGKLLKKPRGKKLIGIYTSSIDHAWIRKSNAWKAERWAELAHRLSKQGVSLALFGAPYDKDTAEYLKGEGIKFIDCVGDQHLGITLEAMKKCDGFIGFPSGLTILAHHLRLPTVMFFPTHLEKMQNTFCKEGSAEAGTWKACQFPTIEQLWQWFGGNKVWSKLLGL